MLKLFPNKLVLMLIQILNTSYIFNSIKLLEIEILAYHLKILIILK